MILILIKKSGNSLKFTIGGEILSGTDGKLNNSNKFSTVSATENNSYTPLYGTNHAHNGYMDMFFVGGQNENQTGLQDLFFKTRYVFSKSLFMQLDIHHFSTAADLYDSKDVKLDKSLGSEIDFSISYNVSGAVSLQFGYSQFLQTETFEALRNKSNPAGTQNWSYLMLVFRPTMANKFIGILF